MTHNRLILSCLASWLAWSACAVAQNTLPPPPPPPPDPAPLMPVVDSPYAPARPWQVQIDPFVMWYNGSRFPALLTTGDPISNPGSTAIPGALGQPGTQVLVGDKAMNNGGVSGVRFTFAYAFDDVLSADIGGFLTQTQTQTIVRVSDPSGSPILARPYFDPNSNQETVDQYRSYPDYFVGATRDSFSTRIGGAEGNVRFEVIPLKSTTRFGFNLFVGFRYLQLDETYSSFDTTADLPVGSGFSSRYSDTFATTNSFLGAQIGATMKLRVQRFALDLTGKLIGGDNNQSVRISGFSSLTDPTGATAIDHNLGLFAQPSNIGHYRRDVFAGGGELGLKFGYQFTDYFRLNVGYTLFLIGNVVRPGEQIDRTVNIQPMFGSGVVGIPRPTFLGHESTFTTQTLNLGFEFLF